MDYNYKKITKYLYYLFFLTFLSTIYSCSNRNRKLCEGNSAGLFFKFTIPASVMPSIDTIKVGDTIYIENKFSSNMLNEANGKSYDISNLDLGLKYYFLDENTSPISVTNNLKTFSIIGSSSTQNSSTGPSTLITYDLTNNIFTYKGGVTFTKAGIYILHFDSFIGVQNLASQGKNITQCPEENVELSINTNNRVDNNWDMFQYCKDTLFKKVTTQDEFNTGGCYCFYIKP